MRRGDIVTAAPPGEFSKPRPVLVVQAFVDAPAERITVVLITSDLLRVPEVRVPVMPNSRNGLQRPSEIAVDNLQTFAIGKVGSVIGSLDERTMELVDEALKRHLGL